jgi:hypothetical protein
MSKIFVIDTETGGTDPQLLHSAVLCGHLKDWALNFMSRSLSRIFASHVMRFGSTG